MDKRTALVVGLDGATWDLLGPWIEAGELPTIKRLMQAGIHSTLLSTVPSYTLPAWTSLITGVNPGKHNVYDIFVSDRGTRRLVTSRDRQTKSIFEILTDYGKMSVAVNIPGTFPPDRIKGAMISGTLTTPGKNSNFIYPESLKEKVSDFFEKSFDFDYRTPRFLSVADKDKLVVMADDIAESEVNATLFLIDTLRPDLVWHVFRTTDQLQHYLYDSKVLQSTNVDYLLAHYRRVDSLVARMIERCSDNVKVLVVSDHGFAPLRKYFHINNWLERQGFLTRRGKNRRLFWVAAGFANKAVGMTRRVGFINRIVLRVLTTRLAAKLTQKTASPLDSIDFANTKAYCASITSQSIRIIEEDATLREELKQEIASSLSQLHDDATGLPIMEQVITREVAYSGQYVTNGPDVVMVAREGYVVTDTFSKRGGYLCPPVSLMGVKTGDHRPEGVFIASSSSTKADGAIPPLRVYDVAPTILRFMGIPIPEYMDGEPRAEVLAKEMATLDSASPSERNQIRSRIRKLRWQGKL